MSKQAITVKRNIPRQPAHVSVIKHHIVDDEYLSLTGNAGRFLQAVTYWPTLFILKFFLHFKVEGQEHLRDLADTEVVFASNHTSFIDGPMAAASMPCFKNKWWPKGYMPIRFTALSEFFHWFNPFFPPLSFLVALYVRYNGSIPVQRSGGDLYRALHNVVRVIKDKSNKDKIWFFPEGGISRDGKIHLGKRGVAHLHKETGVPIVPVGILGSYNITWWQFLTRQRHVTVRIGQPLTAFGEKNLEQISEFVMEKVAVLAEREYINTYQKEHGCTDEK